AHVQPTIWGIAGTAIGLQKRRDSCEDRVPPKFTRYLETEDFMRYPNEKIEEHRRTAGELENELIDEYKGGNLTRRELIQRGSVLGMSLPFLGLLAGGARAAVTRPQAAVRRTATTLRFGGVIPDGSLEPPLLQS